MHEDRHDEVVTTDENHKILRCISNTTWHINSASALHLLQCHNALLSLILLSLLCYTFSVTRIHMQTLFIHFINLFLVIIICL